MSNRRKNQLPIEQHEDIANKLRMVQESLADIYLLTLKTYRKDHSINKRLGKLALTMGDIGVLRSVFDMEFVREYGVARISPHECRDSEEYLKMKDVQGRESEG